MTFSRRIATFLTVLAAATPVLGAPRPILNTDSPNAIPNKYIVVMKKGINGFSAAQDVDRIEHRFNLPNLKGYSGEFDEKTIKKIANNPQVAYIEQEQVYHALKLTTQKDAPWGLARVSRRDSVNGALTGDYLFDDSHAGEGITVYVVDTGILLEHEEFEGRASWGFSSINETDTDLEGHGTHCAGTVAGKTFGVAKKAKVVAVKVLDSNGSGTTSGVLAGIEWIANNATPLKSVASISLGGGKSVAMNDAIEGLVAKDITVSVAAGNENQNADNVSPASAVNAITVGSIDRNDVKAATSNWGPSVDIFAPGREIMSAGIDNPTANLTQSGTSMACPHISGLAAYFMSMNKDGGAKPADVLKWLLANSTPDVIKNLPEKTINKLAYNGVENKPEPAKKCAWWDVVCWLKKLGLVPQNWFGN